LSFGIQNQQIDLTALLGHAHAASGLLHVAAAVLALQQKMQPAQQNVPRCPGYRRANGKPLSKWTALSLKADRLF